MALDLDERQRGMLLEMGVRVWQPEAAAPEPEVIAPAARQQPAYQEEQAVRAAMPSRAAVPAQAPASRPAVPSSLVDGIQPSAVESLPLDTLDWPALVDAAANCQACGLCEGRKNSVLRAPAVAQADWLIVGDPPDEDEDRLGQSFAEASGVLLANMLKAVGAQSTAHATAVVQCRPPQGRNPQPAELAQCAQYLRREIALLQPKVIVAMGRFAIQSLLAEQPELASQPLGRLRGTAYRFAGVPVVVSYHPKLLLRASADKAKAWADLCLAAELVEQA